MNKNLQFYNTILVSAFMALFVFLTTSLANAQFTGGEGTEESPWQVETLEQLQAIQNYKDKHFIQISDIDASGTANWDEEKGFVPIGGQFDPFEGTYDGGGYSIANLTIHRVDETYVGLFGRVGGHVKNIALENVSIQGASHIGALAGYNDGHIEHSSASGTVTGWGYAGGLVGMNQNNGQVIESHANVDVSGETRIGGLVGYNNRSSLVKNSYATGHVTGDDQIGGLVGDNQTDGMVAHSHATGNVTGDVDVGGLIGRNRGDSEISHSYATGKVTGRNRVGGLVGNNTIGPSLVNYSYSTGDVLGTSMVGGLVGSSVSGNVNYSYSHSRVTGENEVGGLIGRARGDFNEVFSTGNVSGNEDAGGLIGTFDGTLSAGYWDQETSGQVTFAGSGVFGEAEGLSTARMTGQEAFIYMHRLGFEQPWQLTSDYPVLSWQEGNDVLDEPIAAIITVEPSPWDYGDVEVDSLVSQLFSLTNKGNMTMNGEVLPLANDTGPFELTQGQGAWSLEPGESRIIEVAFLPGSEGVFHNHIKINHNAANENDPMEIMLSGTGLILQFTDGAGTEEDPYQVATLGDLHKVRYFHDTWFVQVSDIDAASTADWNDGKGFDPIGWWVDHDNNEPFSGSYNGNGYTISNLYIDRQYEDAVGLFGYIDSATLENITLADGHIKGGRITGGLVGRSFGNSRITSSSNSGDVTGISDVGGLIGYKHNGRVTGSYASGNVMASLSEVGGLIGIMGDGGMVTRSYATGNVTGGRSSVGGLIGYSLGRIQESYATGNVTGRDVVGGLAGTSNIEVTGSYATGNVNGEEFIGGLVGWNNGQVNYAFSRGDVTGEMYVGGLIGHNRGRVRESYSTGLVSGTADYGGFIGDYDGLQTSGYWDIETSSQTQGVGKGDQGDAIGLTTAKMTGTAAEINMTSFVFGDKWVSVQGGYPRHFWEVLLDIPFFKISLIENSSSVLEGQHIELKVTVENIGGISGIQDIEIRDGANQLIGKHESLALGSGDIQEVTFSWQAPEGDGDYSYIILSDSDSKNYNFKVYPAPALVDLGLPTNDNSEVDVTPEFVWNTASHSTTYELQLSTDPDFSSLILAVDTLNNASLTLQDPLDPVTRYWWRVRGANNGGNGSWSEIWSFTTKAITSASREDLPVAYELKQNYPNPFNPSTIIRYSIPEHAHVRLEVYNLLGQRVAILVNEDKAPGWYDIHFNAGNLTSGLYLYRMHTASHTESRQMMLVK